MNLLREIKLDFPEMRYLVDGVNVELSKTEQEITLGRDGLIDRI